MANGNGYDERPVDYVRAERGASLAQINNSNTLSTPVLLTALVIFAFFGVGIGYAVTKAAAADDKAVIAEREARLAQRRYDDMRILLEARGINVEE